MSPDLEREDETLVGRVLAGRYHIEGILGRGGMGIVFRARDRQLGEPVAVKMMTAAGTDEVRRFHREVRLARRITHANVARTHDIGEHEGQLFMTMELIEGRSLETILADGPLEPERVIEIGLAVARGLSAAHEAGVVHRDLKPANVLVEDGGRVVITDFGIAKSEIEAGGHTAQVIGTPHYMAPEQVLGQAVSPATDVYAFGLLLFEMLSGQRPFSGDTPMAEMMTRCRGEAPDPARLAAMPEPLADLVRRCLRLTPSERPTSAEVLVQALERWSNVSTARTMAAPGLSGVIASQPLSDCFAPMLTTKRTLAVVPFTYRGPGDTDYLGDTLAQELIDVLSRTRNLRVLAYGATEAHRDLADPRALGRRLGAAAVVTGSVLASGDKVRVHARLIDVESGVQLWTDRFDAGLADLFELQETVSQRIADALRVEIDTAAYRVGTNAEAVDLYLRARRTFHQPIVNGAEDSLQLLERALEVSPDFAPAIAARAVASVRAWWADIARDAANAAGERAQEAVSAALARAPDLAESHLAHAMFALQHGDVSTTANALVLALQIAPTLPEAHRYLGELQAEAGRVEEGVRRLKLAYELDPTFHVCLLLLARITALRGDFRASDRLLNDFERFRGQRVVPAVILRVRIASWRGDHEALKALLPAAERLGGSVGLFLVEYIRFLRGEGDAQSIARYRASTSRFGNPRLESVARQVSAEGLGLRGYRREALEILEEAANATLVDVEWLERCPALASLRDDPRFAAVAARVRERASAIWTLR